MHPCLFECSIGRNLASRTTCVVFLHLERGEGKSGRKSGRGWRRGRGRG
jgi:hypothetical protein